MLVGDPYAVRLADLGGVGGGAHGVHDLRERAGRAQRDEERDGVRPRHVGDEVLQQVGTWVDGGLTVCRAASQPDLAALVDQSVTRPRLPCTTRCGLVARRRAQGGRDGDGRAVPRCAPRTHEVSSASIALAR